MTCKDTLAQRAADELNVAAKTPYWRHYDIDTVPMQTTMRLLARIDELEAQPTRRSEPMPEPVPEWLRRAVEDEQRKDDYNEAATIARLIWERGDAEPVDPDVQIVRDILHAHQRAMTPPNGGWGDMSYAKGSYDHLPVFQSALAAYKRGMELAKEIG